MQAYFESQLHSLRAEMRGIQCIPCLDFTYLTGDVGTKKVWVIICYSFSQFGCAHFDSSRYSRLTCLHADWTVYFPFSWVTLPTTCDLSQESRPFQCQTFGSFSLLTKQETMAWSVPVISGMFLRLYITVCELPICLAYLNHLIFCRLVPPLLAGDFQIFRRPTAGIPSLKNWQPQPTAPRMRGSKAAGQHEGRRSNGFWKAENPTLMSFNTIIRNISLNVGIFAGWVNQRLRASS